MRKFLAGARTPKECDRSIFGDFVGLVHVEVVAEADVVGGTAC